MSVMEQLKATAGQGNSMESFDEGSEAIQMSEMMEANAIPGQSLTQDPENPMPYETPPEFPEVQDFLDEAFLELSDPDKLPSLLQTMRSNVPVEYMAEKFLMKAFQKGKINMDVFMLSIEPIIYTLISLATYAQIEPVLYPEDDMMDGEQEELTDKFRKGSRELLVGEDTNNSGGLTVDEIEAPSVAPRSLLARSKKAVENLGEI